MTMTDFHHIGEEEIKRARKILKSEQPQIGLNSHLILASAKADCVYDIHGNEYIDCISQNWVASIGHNHPKVLEAVKQCLDSNLTHAITRVDTIHKLKLASRILDLSPKSMVNVSFSLGGSLAVEGAMKLCLHRDTSAPFAALSGGYHGRTLATIMLSFLRHRKKDFQTMFKDDIIEIPRAYCFRCKYGKRNSCSMECLAEADYIFSKTKPIGFIYEPIQGDGGQLDFPTEFHLGLRQLCTKYNIPMIVDEIQTGFGKMDTIFAFQHYGFEPDIITFGKAIGGGFPLFGTINTADFEWRERDHTFTFSHFPISMAASLATLDIIEEEDICGQADIKGKLIRESISSLDYTCIGEVRGEGLLIGIEFVDDDNNPDTELCKKVIDYSLSKGVLFGNDFNVGNTLKIKPPSVITEEHIDKVISVLDEAIREVIRKTK